MKRSLGINLILLGSGFILLIACSNSPTNGDLPAAPSALAGLATGAYSVSLQWTDNSANENSFLIFRKITGSYEQSGRVSADQSFYKDIIPVSCIEVSYYIVAESADGQSERSNVITVPLLCGDEP